MFAHSCQYFLVWFWVAHFIGIALRNFSRNCIKLWTLTCVTKATCIMKYDCRVFCSYRVHRPLSIPFSVSISQPKNNCGKKWKERSLIRSNLNERSFFPCSHFKVDELSGSSKMHAIFSLSLRCWHLIPIGEFLLKLICNLHLDLSLRFFTTRFCVESRIFNWIVDFNHSNLSNRYAKHENSDEISWKSKWLLTLWRSMVFLFHSLRLYLCRAGPCLTYNNEFISLNQKKKWENWQA